MNTTIAIRPQVPVSPQTDTAAANTAAQASPAGNGTGFANTLHSVAPKPAKKSSNPKEPGGTSVPPPGNDSPPAAAQPATVQTQAQGAPDPAAGKGQIDNSRTKTQAVTGDAGPSLASPATAQITPDVSENAAATESVQPAGIPIAALMAQLNAATEPDVAAPPLAPLPQPPVASTLASVTASQNVATAAVASTAASTAASSVAAPSAAVIPLPAATSDRSTSAVKSPPVPATKATPTTEALPKVAKTAVAHIDSRTSTGTDGSSSDDSIVATVGSDAKTAPADPAPTLVQILTAPVTPPAANPAALTDGDDDSGNSTPTVQGIAPAQLKAVANVQQAQDSRPVAAAAHATEAQIVVNVADGGATDKHSSNVADASVGAAAASGPGTFNATLNHVGATDAAGYRVQAPVDSSDFGSGVAHQVSLMVNNSENSAKLQVNPPALGPIEVRIALQGDHAQIFMASHSAVTREALQSSSPQLKEMLGSQGFGQVSVDISHRSFQERTPTAQHYERNLGPTETAAASTTAAVRVRSSSSVLDAYA